MEKKKTVVNALIFPAFGHRKSNTVSVVYHLILSAKI